MKIPDRLVEKFVVSEKTVVKRKWTAMKFLSVVVFMLLLLNIGIISSTFYPISLLLHKVVSVLSRSMVRTWTLST